MVERMKMINNISKVKYERCSLLYCIQRVIIKNTWFIVHHKYISVSHGLLH